MTLQLRRGTRTDLPAALDVGEPGWITDDEVLVIGQGTGNAVVEINPAGSDDPASFTAITAADTMGTVELQVGTVLNTIVIPPANRARLVISENGTDADPADADTFAVVTRYDFTGDSLTIHFENPAGNTGAFGPAVADIRYQVETGIGTDTFDAQVASIATITTFSEDTGTGGTLVYQPVATPGFLNPVIPAAVRTALADTQLVPGSYRWDDVNDVWVLVAPTDAFTTVR